jgi:uncharacterized protein YjbJ (UPF0337 family)
MNWDQVAGKWKQFRGQFKERWGQLTDDDLDVIDGQREQFVGVLQERYGIAKEVAENEIKDFLAGLDDRRVTSSGERARRAG